MIYSDTVIFRDVDVTCRDFVKLLGEYVDGELPEALARQLALHGTACPKCQELERGYRLTIELAAELESQPLPEGVQDRLRQALNSKLNISLPEPSKK